MNIEKWIEENTEWLVDEEDIQVVPVSALIELLKTHAIVPREPSDEIIKGMQKDKFTSKLIKSIAKEKYKAMIEAAENEQ